MAPAEIRTVTDVEELREAAGVIVHYFGREKPDEAWAGRWLKTFELERMHTALDDVRSSAEPAPLPSG
jgi:hypothetical protein